MHEQNQPAPAFTLPDQDGTARSLTDFHGRWVLLYFYPKDNTPGCTQEACGLRDRMKEYEERGCTVIGISTDSVQSHRRFADAHGLPFMLLSDEQKEVVKLYDVWKPKVFLGKEYLGTMRTSFLIDSDGIIRHVYPDVSPEEHADEVLKDLDTELA